MVDVVSPFLRTPFTDITGVMISYNGLGRCSKQEMDLMDCMEAYGYSRGTRKCKDYMEEFRECHTLKKQFARYKAMRIERDRQISCGLLSGDKEYVTPRIDSY